jgi:hypothetical protein
MPRPTRFTPGKDSVPTVRKAGWVQGSVWLYPVQEVQLIVEYFSLTQGSGPVSQRSRNRFYAGRLVMWSGLQAEVCVGRFPVDLMASAFSHSFTALLEWNV